jgi:hypothetical protein
MPISKWNIFPNKYDLDQLKKISAEKRGFEYFVIWENEDPHQIIDKILEKIYDYIK